jgi:hypothetical protein
MLFISSMSVEEWKIIAERIVGLTDKPILWEGHNRLIKYLVSVFGMKNGPLIYNEVKRFVKGNPVKMTQTKREQNK